MKRIITYIFLFSLPVAAFLVVIWALPVKEQNKWARLNTNCSKASTLYHLLTKEETPIEVAFIGTSRTMAAVYDSVLEQELGYRVVNLGYCRPGRNLQFEILKLLFEHHKPTLIFIELWTEEDWYGHYDFGNVASTNDVLFSLQSKNPHYLADVSRNFRMKFDLFQQNLLEKNPMLNSTKNYGHWPAGPIQRPIYPSNFEALNTPQQRFTSEFYLLKMIALCKENNAKIIFNCLPTFGLSGTKPHYYEFYQHYGQVLLDPQVFKNENFWVDSFHLSPEGSAFYTDYLLQQSLK